MVCVCVCGGGGGGGERGEDGGMRNFWKNVKEEPRLGGTCPDTYHL